MSFHIQFATKIFRQLASKGLKASNPLDSQFIYVNSQVKSMLIAFLKAVVTEENLEKIDKSHHELEAKIPSHPKHHMYNFLKEIIFNEENLNNLELMAQRFKEAEELFKLQLENWLSSSTPPTAPKPAELHAMPIVETKVAKDESKKLESESKESNVESKEVKDPAKEIPPAKKIESKDVKSFTATPRPIIVEEQLQNLIHELIVHGGIHQDSPAAVEDLGDLLKPFASLPIIQVLPTVQFLYDKKSCQVLNSRINEMLLDNKKILLGITHNGRGHFVMFEIRFLPHQKYQICIIDSIREPTRRIEFDEPLATFLKKFNIPYDLVENGTKIDINKLLKALEITAREILDLVKNNQLNEWLKKFSSDEAFQIQKLLYWLGNALVNEVLLDNIRSAIQIKNYHEDRNLALIVYRDEQPAHNNDCLFYAARSVMEMLINIPRCVIDEEVILAIKNPNIRPFKLYVLKETVRTLQQSEIDGIKNDTLSIDISKMRYDEEGAIFYRASYHYDQPFKQARNDFFASLTEATKQAIIEGKITIWSQPPSHDTLLQDLGHLVAIAFELKELIRQSQTPQERQQMDIESTANFIRAVQAQAVNFYKKFSELTVPKDGAPRYYYDILKNDKDRFLRHFEEMKQLFQNLYLLKLSLFASSSSSQDTARNRAQVDAIARTGISR